MRLLLFLLHSDERKKNSERKKEKAKNCSALFTLWYGSAFAFCSVRLKCCTQSNKKKWNNISLGRKKKHMPDRKGKQSVLVEHKHCTRMEENNNNDEANRTRRLHTSGEFFFSPFQERMYTKPTINPQRNNSKSGRLYWSASSLENQQRYCTTDWSEMNSVWHDRDPKKQFVTPQIKIKYTSHLRFYHCIHGCYGFQVLSRTHHILFS